MIKKYFDFFSTWLGIFKCNIFGQVDIFVSKLIYFWNIFNWGKEEMASLAESLKETIYENAKPSQIIGEEKRNYFMLRR